MEHAYEFDHYDYPGQPWHKSTSITFTITDSGIDVVLAKADTETHLSLTKERFPEFNKHFGQPENQPILLTAYKIHKANRGGEVREALETLGTKEFGRTSDTLEPCLSESHTTNSPPPTLSSIQFTSQIENFMPLRLGESHSIP